MDLAYTEEGRMESRGLVRALREPKTSWVSKAFTLMELVIVLVILSILAAIAIPKYVDLSATALAAAKDGMSGAVKSAFAIAVAENKAEPTVTALAGYVLDSSVTAVATGIQVTIDGTDYTVPTYTDTTCATATSAVTDTVKCVGDIS